MMGAMIGRLGQIFNSIVIPSILAEQDPIYLSYVYESSTSTHSDLLSLSHLLSVIS